MRNEEDECTCKPSSRRAERMSCKRRHDSVILLAVSIKPSAEAVLSGLRAAQKVMEEFPSEWKEHCVAVAHLDKLARKKIYLKRALQYGFDAVEKRLDDPEERVEDVMHTLKGQVMKSYKAMLQEDCNLERAPLWDARINELEARVREENLTDAD